MNSNDVPNEVDEEMNERENENLDERFIKLALRELHAIVLRPLEVVQRYFQFRMRDMIARGVRVNFSSDIEINQNEVKLILKVTIPWDFVEEYARNYSYFTRLARKIQRTAGAVDRYLYRHRDVEERAIAEEVENVAGEEHERQ